MRNISNSEVTAWLSCRLMYYFAFYRNLAPKSTPDPLARGTLGHLAFEKYAEARLNGMTHEQAYKVGQQVFAEAMATVNLDIVLQTKFLWERYMNFHQGWPEWIILGTEKQIDLKVTDTLSIPIRYDMLVQERRTNRKLVVDFKFTYEFWSSDDHALNGQAPKYIAIMNNNGMQVDGAILEEVRTRKLSEATASDPKKLWRRTSYFPSDTKKRMVLKQHIVAGMEIERYRTLDERQREAETVPVLNKHGACKYCNFKELCAIKLDGGDVDLAVSMGFVDNTYGYNKQDDSVNIEDLI